MDTHLVVERVGTEADAEARDDIRERLGQFMTPAPVATFMAGLFGSLPSDIRLLDAGAGQGALTAAFIAEACARPVPPRSISATAFEVDGAMLPYLRAAMDSCARMCAAAGVAFECVIINEDYVIRSRVSDLLCMSDPVHASPKGSMNDHLERNLGRTAAGRGAA